LIGIGNQGGQHVDETVGQAAMTRMFQLADVLELVIDGLDQSALAKQNFIQEWEQAGLHVFFEFGDQMHALGPELREEGLGDVAAIATQFAEPLSGRRCQVGGRMRYGGGVAVRKTPSEASSPSDRS
jgi:hypothetical protein